MSTKDSARLTMDSCVGREREDQAVKRLFSRKDFLANIMKGTIAEYADLSIEEIMDCIEGDTIQTGTALVSEDAANTIRGENPQFTAIGEAPAIMDLIFRSLVPSLDETIKINLHVDLEFQQDYAVPYPVEKRAFFSPHAEYLPNSPKLEKMEPDIKTWRRYTVSGSVWRTSPNTFRDQSLITKWSTIRTLG